MVSWGILRPLALGGIISCLREPLSIPLQCLSLAGGQTYGRALLRSYLERCSVHACIQLCTRGYTVVYTRVYFPLLGSRDILGEYMPRE